MVSTSRDPAEADRTSSEVVASVAEAKGVPPAELDPPLYDAINPDALDRVVETGASPAEQPSVVVRFSYCGFSVRVTENTIRLSEDGESGGSH